MMKYITPTLTALKHETEIDIESCLKHYDFLMRAGVDGVAIFGSTGEFPHLPLKQKQDLIRAAVKHIKNRMQVIVGTGEMRSEDCIQLSSFALEQGADAVMVVSPYYFALNDTDVMQYYSRIAFEIQGKIYIYNYPERTGYSISPEVVLQLAKKHPNIVGIKDTIPDMLHTVKLIQTVKSVLPDFEVFSGFDYNFASNIMAGGDGCIAALSNIRPDLCVAWRDSIQKGDFCATLRFQKVFNDIINVYGLTSPFMSGMKSILVDMGLFHNDLMTFPYQKSSEAQKQTLRQFMSMFEHISPSIN